MIRLIVKTACLFAGTAASVPAGPFGVERSKPIEVGYFHFKRTIAHIHAYVPEDYDPARQYPLIIALHRQGGTAQQLIPDLQLHADRHDFILACPDSENQFNWEVEELYLQRNLSIIKQTHKYFRKRYNLAPDRQFLMGQGFGGGTFIFFLLSKTHSLLNRFDGVIVMGAESQTEFEEGDWTRPHPHSRHAVPILYINARDSTQVPYTRSRWMRDFFRSRGYLVHYIEIASAGNIYPARLNPKIFEWCLQDKHSFDDIEEPPPVRPMPVTGEFDISFFGLNAPGIMKSAEAKELVSSSVQQKDRQTPGRGTVSFRVAFRPDYEFMRKDRKIDIKDVYRNIRVIVRVFDQNKKLTYSNETRFFGLDEGNRQIRDYKREYYGAIFNASDRQVDYLESLQGGEAAVVNIEIPYDRPREYAAVKIFKGEKLVAFRMYPEGVDHKQFPDLENIELRDMSVKEEIEEERRIDEEYEKEDLDSGTGYFRVVE